jgi:hypothetical protein
MVTPTASKTSASVPWSDHDVFVLLSTLNFLIEDVRSAIEKDEKTGPGVAAQLLSDAIGNGCTPTRVERKIKHLWSQWGSDEGDKRPVDIYKYGALPKTFPRLDPALLARVAVRVAEMQR